MSVEEKPLSNPPINRFYHPCMSLQIALSGVYENRNPISFLLHRGIAVRHSHLIPSPSPMHPRPLNQRRPDKTICNKEQHRTQTQRKKHNPNQTEPD